MECPVGVQRSTVVRGLILALSRLLTLRPVATHRNHVQSLLATTTETNERIEYYQCEFSRPVLTKPEYQ